jgi:hypothetical protein
MPTTTQKLLTAKEWTISWDSYCWTSRMKNSRSNAFCPWWSTTWRDFSQRNSKDSNFFSTSIIDCCIYVCRILLSISRWVLLVEVVIFLEGESGSQLFCCFLVLDFVYKCFLVYFVFTYADEDLGYLSIGKHIFRLLL